VIRYKDHRLAIVSAKTVKDSDLSTLRAVFGYGVRNRKITANPAEGVTFPRAKRIRERDPDFSTDEIKLILSLARGYAASDGELPTTAAAKRWVPWLCAYTGARVGEMVQLRKSDIAEAAEGWFLTITPEAGTVKSGGSRRAPIHEHLIAEGFLDFVRGARDGYLFVNAKPGEAVRGRVRAAKNRLAEFIRTVVADKRVSPNHGWRHTFKTVAREADIENLTADAICGHSPRTEGERYGRVTLKARANAIRKFPRYGL
jgi:integrase